MKSECVQFAGQRSRRWTCVFHVAERRTQQLFDHNRSRWAAEHIRSTWRTSREHWTEWVGGVHCEQLLLTRLTRTVSNFKTRCLFFFVRVCAGIAWNKDGDLLAVINEQTQTLLIWESSSNRMRHIESGLRDALNLLLWSKRNSHLLAITSIKGEFHNWS